MEMRMSATSATFARLVMAAIACAVAATSWWMTLDDIALDRALATPFPYLLLAFAIFGGIPAWVLAKKLLGARLWLMLTLALIGASVPAIFALDYFLYPRNAFAAFLIWSTAIVGAIAFWLQARGAKLSGDYA